MIPKQAFEKALDLIILELKKKHNELGQKATGDWQRSLESNIVGNKGFIIGLDYTEWLVKGSKPNSLPPIKPLERWAKAKFGVRGKQALGIAFAVANKIKKEGTEIHKRGGTDLLEILEEQRIFDLLNDVIALQYEPLITKQLTRIL